jgi:hypothetical protein
MTDFTPPADTLILPPVVCYGVWLAGKGWWKHADTQRVFATENLSLAQQQAKWLRGRVLIIDDSLQAFEAQMLQAEAEQRQRKKTWRIWTK